MQFGEAAKADSDPIAVWSPQDRRQHSAQRGLIGA